ncbi:MAG: crossover junction endodeoxyribonuclease RuvC [Bacteroidetes bacterium]|nr:crossover junction endodeoxyribonuclease RuvC [Bacteroidota bacterium]
MGYGVIEGGPQPRAEDYGVIGLSKSMPIEQRLYQLYTHILNLIHIFTPDAIAVEEPFVGRGERFFAGPAIAVMTDPQSSEGVKDSGSSRYSKTPSSSDLPSTKGGRGTRGPSSSSSHTSNTAPPPLVGSVPVNGEPSGLRMGEGTMISDAAMINGVRVCSTRPVMVKNGARSGADRISSTFRRCTPSPTKIT